MKTMSEMIAGDVIALFDGTKTGAGTTYTDNIPIGWIKSAIFLINCTAKSGTTPTLDVVLENVDPITGKIDTDIVIFTQLTDIGAEWKHALESGKKLANVVRLKITLGGATPSFTFKVMAHAKHN